MRYENEDRTFEDTVALKYVLPDRQTLQEMCNEFTRVTKRTFWPEPVMEDIVLSILEPENSVRWTQIWDPISGWPIDRYLFKD